MLLKLKIYHIFFGGKFSPNIKDVPPSFVVVHIAQLKTIICLHKAKVLIDVVFKFG